LDRFFGTLAPFFRASDRPMAIACFLLFTFLPDRPLFNVPDLRFFMARPTFFAAPFEYLRFFAFFAISLILNVPRTRAGAVLPAFPRVSRRAGRGRAC
jgi:hypothetical protein